MISVSIHGITDKGSWVILTFLLLNLITACTFEISCESFIPTLSYLATFRDYDILIVLAICIYCFMLLPMFLGFHLKVINVLGLGDLIIMGLFEAAIVVIGITVALVDEINGVEFNPVDNLHVYLSFALTFLCFSWVYYALKFMEKSNLSICQKDQIKGCWIRYKISWVLYIITILEWHFAYSIYNNSIANPLVESLLEWTLITLAFRFPVKLAEIMDYSIIIIQTNKSNTN